jgi:Tfp pilus assembly protein PilF
LVRRALLGMLLLAAAIPACADTNQERLQRLNEDGVFLYRKGNYDDARLSFESALKLLPDDPTLLYDIGQCYDRSGDAAKAEKIYRDCLEEAPNHAPCRHALAVLMLRQGRRQETDQLIESWLAQQPNLADAYVEDGWRLRQDGDLLQAQARLQQALNLDPHNVRGLVEMGLLYEIMDRPSRALNLYEQALQLDAQQPDVAARVNALLARGVQKPLPD